MAGPVVGSSRDGGTPARHAAAVSGTALVRGPGELRHSLPWLLILFITAGFHFYRGVPVDGWIFLSAGLVLGADTAFLHVRRQPAHLAAGEGRPPRMSGRALVWTMLAVGVGAAVVVVLAPPGSLGIPAVVGLVGVAMLLVAWPQSRSPARPRTGDAAQQAGGRAAREPGTGEVHAHAPKPLRRAAWWWAAVLLFLALWELGNYFADMLDPAGAWAFPPLTDLLQPLFDNDASRWLMMIVWLAACAGLVRSAVKP